MTPFLVLWSRCRVGLAGGVALAAMTGCGGSAPAGSPVHPPAVTSATASPSAGSGAVPSAVSGSPSAVVPRPAHTVVVVMENHSYGEVVGNPAAPFINRLARSGALFARSFAVTRPGRPDYLALFSGSAQGVPGGSCPRTFAGPNLAAGLAGAGMSFAGYEEDLPAAGAPVCSQGQYARRHGPWTDFSNVPGSVGRPFTRWPAGDFAGLPTVSFVIPNLCSDMHDCGVAVGDAWPRAHVGGYADWAMRRDSLLILTWDENDGSPDNQVPTILAGQQVGPGRYAEPVTHYNGLATIETACALPRSGQAATARPITDIWAR